MAVRVAHITPTDRIACLMMRTRLLHLRDAGYEVSIICGRSPEGAWGAELNAQGLKVIHVPFAREIAPFTDARCALAMYRVIRRGGYDIVHSHNPKGGLLGPVAGKLARRPVVLHTVHGFLFNENATGMRRGMAQAAERWTAAWCDHLLFQSEEDFAYARDHRFKTGDRLHLEGNGIDETRFDPRLYPEARREKRAELGLGESDLVVGMVGRLVEEKGYREFFEMAGRLARAREDVRFLNVGIAEPEQSDAVDPGLLARQHGLDGKCVLLDRRRDMPELYLAMDVAVLPSHREGIPRALMEAAAMGLPGVATDIRGTREVVEDGVTGLLFPLRDVDRFLVCVERLLQDGGLRRRMGRAAQQRVLGKYTETATSRRLQRCYREILDREAGGAGAREKERSDV